MLKEIYKWIDERHVAGAKKIGATCNPIRLELYITAGADRFMVKCPTMRETRILKDIVNEYIAALPLRCDACTGHGGKSLMPNGEWVPDECPVCGSKPDE